MQTCCYLENLKNVAKILNQKKNTLACLCFHHVGFYIYFTITVTILNLYVKVSRGRRGSRHRSSTVSLAHEKKHGTCRSFFTALSFSDLKKRYAFAAELTGFFSCRLAQQDSNKRHFAPSSSEHTTTKPNYLFALPVTIRCLDESEFKSEPCGGCNRKPIYFSNIERKIISELFKKV